MFLDKEILKKVVGGSPANGGTSPDLPTREPKKFSKQESLKPASLSDSTIIKKALNNDAVL
ncbi:hypothetical protein [Pseudoalteromonas phenolica]|uniref:hypothetical protein n=1 Tax=Pseudoalteromonas phenolica TaxID=161398 RepID=UPI00110B0A38|nr:hypothetical protein [Pseudoalteromonas phenolica]TMO54922.1 hypothetical protein CWC21_12875 [Pseudoalteromonas phenolica]